MKKNVPVLRFKGFEEEWKEREISEFLTESRILGSDGSKAKKLTVKLWGKGVVPKRENYQGSDNTTYYTRKAGQFIYGKLDFLNCAFGIIPKELDGYESTVDAPAFDIKDINSYFLLGKIIQKDFYKKNGEIADGSRKAKRIHANTFLNMTLKIPALQEQEKIANFLTKVDSLIEKQDEKVKNFELYKKGMMQKIFSQEIRFKDNNRCDYPKWEEKKLKSICTINQGLQIAISERFSEYKNGRYFYITNEFLKVGSDKKYYINNPNESVLCKENDILMTRTGNTGKVVTNVSGAFHNNFFKVNYNRKLIIKGYIYYYLIYDKTQKIIRRLAGSSTIPDLNHNDFYNIKMNIPNLEEQIKIAKCLSNIDTILDKESKKLEELKEWKKGLLQQMFV